MIQTTSYTSEESYRSATACTSSPLLYSRTMDDIEYIQLGRMGFRLNTPRYHSRFTTPPFSAHLTGICHRLSKQSLAPNIISSMPSKFAREIKPSACLLRRAESLYMMLPSPYLARSVLAPSQSSSFDTNNWPCNSSFQAFCSPEHSVELQQLHCSLENQQLLNGPSSSLVAW